MVSRYSRWERQEWQSEATEEDAQLPPSLAPTLPTPPAELPGSHSLMKGLVVWRVSTCIWRALNLLVNTHAEGLPLTHWEAIANHVTSVTKRPNHFFFSFSFGIFVFCLPLYFVFLFLFYFGFGTGFHSVAPVGLELTILPTSVSQMLRLQVCTIMLSWNPRPLKLFSTKFL
jgi:hypothetical protein